MDIRWHDRPPEGHDLPGMDLRRTPGNGSIAGIITSQKPVVVPTHFFGGQTVPCVSRDCPACAAQRGKTWHVYLGLFTPSPSQHIIFECTAQAAHELYTKLDAGQQIRGAKLAASRKAKRNNAKVIIALDFSTIGKWQLPAEPDLKAQLTRIWRIVETRAGNEHPDYARQVSLEHGAQIIEGPQENYPVKANEPSTIPITKPTRRKKGAG